jgi:hypothetical protein
MSTCDTPACEGWLAISRNKILGQQSRKALEKED